MATPELTVSATNKFDFKYTDADRSVNLNEKRGSFTYKLIKALTNGTGEKEADLLYSAYGSIAEDSVTLDFVGELIDAHENTLSYVKVKGLCVFN